MAALPTYVRMALAGASIALDPAVEAFQAERGPDQLLVTSQTKLMTLSVKLMFDTVAASLDFEDWYCDTIGCIGWFDFKDPRNGAVRSGRFQGGALGALTPTVAGFLHSERTAVVEYLR